MSINFLGFDVLPDPNHPVWFKCDGNAFGESPQYAYTVKVGPVDQLLDELSTDPKAVVLNYNWSTKTGYVKKGLNPTSKTDAVSRPNFTAYIKRSSQAFKSRVDLVPDEDDGTWLRFPWSLSASMNDLAICQNSQVAAAKKWALQMPGCVAFTAQRIAGGYNFFAKSTVSIDQNDPHNHDVSGECTYVLKTFVTPADSSNTSNTVIPASSGGRLAIAAPISALSSLPPSDYVLVQSVDGYANNPTMDVGVLRRLVAGLQNRGSTVLISVDMSNGAYNQNRLGALIRDTGADGLNLLQQSDAILTDIRSTLPRTKILTATSSSMLDPYLADKADYIFLTTGIRDASTKAWLGISADGAPFDSHLTVQAAKSIGNVGVWVTWSPRMSQFVDMIRGWL